MTERPYERLEPRSRSDDPREGLLARVADPLWMLARQRQLGEWSASNRGAPVSVHITTNTDVLEKVQLGSGAWESIASVLEAQVEHEPAVLTWRMRVQVGQLFERLLVEAFKQLAVPWIAALRESHGVRSASSGEVADDEARRMRRLYAGRAIDGKLLFDALTLNAPPGTVNVPSNLAMSPTQRARFVKASLLWLSRSRFGYCVTVPKNSAAWKSDELAYGFKILSRRGRVFGAPHYTSGSLDWHTLGIDDDIDDSDKSDPALGLRPWLAPTRVTFKGMPEPRIFDIEDHELSFDALTVDKVDWLKLCLRKFAFDFRNDWWHVPLRADTGTFVRIKSLVVTDTFGVDYSVEPARDASGGSLDRWSVFAITNVKDGTPQHGLLLPHVTADKQESDPIEEVMFLFDELENRVWAVEKIIQNHVGDPVSGPLYHLRIQENRLGLVRTSERKALEDGVANARGALDEAWQYLTRPGVSTAVAASRIEAARVKLAIALAALAALAAKGIAGTTTTGPSWRLGHPAPPERIPYVVRRIVGTEQVAYRRARISLIEGGTSAAVTRLIADPAGSKWLREEVVQKVGSRLCLTAQMTRSTVGEVRLWWGRRRCN